MFEEKIETTPDSLPITVIDPDDQPMWLSTRTVAPTPSSAIVKLPIYYKFRIKGTHMQMIQENQFDGRIWFDPHQHIAETYSNMVKIKRKQLDDSTQGILDTGGIFLYKTPNKAFKIFKDKVLLKLDFSKSSQNIPNKKTVVSAGGSNINPNHEILMEKFKVLATKTDSEFLIIKKELKEMRDGRRDNYASQTCMSDDTPMCDPNEANYVHRYHGGYHKQNSWNS
ncbi:hypothetical protein Tco_0801075 [Tanacetum coccineum]|uniref:Uncharacterized protein n=1 Tax=Tanacetum coccineum TaxID=301880 RepID=A0ABQ4ZZ18_9ASTR